MDTSELKRMREEENAKLKKMFADVSLQNQAMKKLFEKSVLCERSTFPFKCGEPGLFGRNLIPYSIILSWLF